MHMSLLNLRKKKKEVKDEPRHLTVAPAASVVASVTSREGLVSFAGIIRHPRVTEKASAMAMRAVYVFDIMRAATKPEIRKAIFSLYKVVPRKIAVLPVPYKRVTVKGRRGWTGGGKKAYVYLKKGEKIEVI